MHDSRTWRQRTGVKTLSHPPTLLEGQGQLPPKTIVILTKPFSTSGPNLVILA